MSDLADKKYWISCRADELALEKYGKDLYDLPDDLQLTVYQRAMDDYINEYSSWLDHVYESEKDRRMK